MYKSSVRRGNFAAAAATVLLATLTLAECTGMYVGRKVCAEGVTLIGRTADFSDMRGLTMLISHPRIENMPGRHYISKKTGNVWPLPVTTWSYVSTPRCAADHRRGLFDSACVNEKGVMLSGTVTGATTDTAKAADPFVKTGFGEESIPGLLAQCCATARAAVELLGRVVAEKGHVGPEIYMIADRDEVWYVEVYTGHQWAAVKAPDDKVAVIGNSFMLHAFDTSSADTLCSQDLVELPRRAGFLKCTPDGKIDLAATYAKLPSEYSAIRTWYGHRLWAPASAGEYDPTKKMPLFYKPERQIGLRDVQELQRCRYEGTKWCPEESGNSNVRVIGTPKQATTHILALDASLPEATRCTLWATIGTAEFSPFLPLNAAVSENAPGYDVDLCLSPFRYDESIAAANLKRLAALCRLDRKKYGAGVRAYWRALEDRWIKEFPALVREGDAERITAYARAAQQFANEEAKRIFDELTWYVTNTTYIDGDYPKPREGIPARFEPSAPIRPWCPPPSASAPKFIVLPEACTSNRLISVSAFPAKIAVAAGYVPIVLPRLTDTNMMERVMDRADALLITGGVSKEDWDVRAEFDKLLIGMAIRRGLPVVGFCHGHQLINLYFGGTIERIDQAAKPDIPHMKRTPGGAVARNFHPAKILPGTLLADWLGTEEIEVNSSHICEVRKLGEGLRITAVAPDGTIEAIEHLTLPMTGFQFHPETRFNEDGRFLTIFKKALERN